MGSGRFVGCGQEWLHRGKSWRKFGFRFWRRRRRAEKIAAKTSSGRKQMKTLKTLNYIATFLLAALVTAVSQQADPATDKPKSADAPNGAAKTDTPAPDENSPASPSAAAKPRAPGDGTLRLNFRGVPIDMVLDHLSDAAGFIIIKETDVKGKVDAWSNQPLTIDEAV